MSKVASTKTKKNRHMGEGENKDYSPYITTSEFKLFKLKKEILELKMAFMIKKLFLSKINL
jgi:hypothetical protein